MVARACTVIDVTAALAGAEVPSYDTGSAVARLAISDRDTCVLYDVKPSGKLASPRRLLPEHPACVEVLGPQPEEGGSSELPFPKGQGTSDATPAPTPIQTPASSTSPEGASSPAPLPPAASQSPSPDDYAEGDGDDPERPNNPDDPDAPGGMDTISWLILAVGVFVVAMIVYVAIYGRNPRENPPWE